MDPEVARRRLVEVEPVNSWEMRNTWDVGSGWELNPDDKRDMGGKAFGIAEMRALGIEQVPPMLVVSAAVGRKSREQGYERLPDGFMKRLQPELERLGEQTSQFRNDGCNWRFGGVHAPMLLAVRSGSEESMPGQLVTNLNLGINPKLARNLGSVVGHEVAGKALFGYLTDFLSWRYGMGRKQLNAFLNNHTEIREMRSDVAYHVIEPSELVYKEAEILITETQALADFLGIDEIKIPTEPEEQLEMAIKRVFASWDSKGARLWRHREGVDENVHTAVGLMPMFWPTKEGGNSGAGVFMTHDLHSGAVNARPTILSGGMGTEVVDAQVTSGAMKVMPIDKAWELYQVGLVLQRHKGEAIDLEYVVESMGGEDRLVLLQQRGARVSARAKVEVLASMVGEGIVDINEIVERLRQVDIEGIKPGLDPESVVLAEGKSVEKVLVGEEELPVLIARGEPVGGGPGTGPWASGECAEDVRDGSSKDVVLVCENLDGGIDFTRYAGVVATAGLTISHAGVVASGMNVPTVVGCNNIKISDGEMVLDQGDMTLGCGEDLTVDGDSGSVYWGNVPREKRVRLSDKAQQLIDWKKEQVGGGSVLVDSVLANNGLEKLWEDMSSLKQILDGMRVGGFPRSEKAKQQYILNRYLDKKMLNPMEVFRAETNRYELAEWIYRGWDLGREATMRSCFVGEPDKKGKAPWIRFPIGRRDMVEAFLGLRTGVVVRHDEKPESWLSLDGWGSLGDLSELMIGWPPDGVLDPDQAEKYFICSMKLIGSVKPRMTVYLIPGTAHARSFGMPEFQEKVVKIKAVVGQQFKRGIAGITLSCNRQELSEEFMGQVEYGMQRDSVDFLSMVEQLNPLLAEELNLWNLGLSSRSKGVLVSEMVGRARAGDVYSVIRPMLRSDVGLMVDMVVEKALGGIWWEELVRKMAGIENVMGFRPAFEFQGSKLTNLFDIYDWKGMEEQNVG